MYAIRSYYVEGNPKVINHNIESIPRLYNQVRPGANYIRSLNILKYIKSRSSILTKSGIMLGLGESMDEVKDVLKDLRSVHCDLLTIGQYCQPTIKHLPVSDYITPEFRITSYNVCYTKLLRKYYFDRIYQYYTSL